MTTFGLASIGMAALSCFGLWLSGCNPRWGWIYGLVSQVPWAVYGAWTGQPGLIVMSVVFAALYGRSLWRWRHSQFQVVDDKEPEPCGV